MKKIILLFIVCLVYQFSYAQLEKDTWLVGGSGNFSSTKAKNTLQDDYTSSELNVSTSLGYFPLNKLAVGVMLDYRYLDVDTYNNPSYFGGSTSGYNFGPFIRYYFLPVQHPVNIFFQTDYGLQFDRNILNLRKIAIKAGPVVYINSNVGLEFNIGYSNSKNENNTENTNSIIMGLGLQIHLKK